MPYRGYGLGLWRKIKNKFLGTWGQIGTFSFDFAKNITTGEGGMILFKNKKDYKKAIAWHDHGHENNPKSKDGRILGNPQGLILE